MAGRIIRGHGVDLRKTHGQLTSKVLQRAYKHQPYDYRTESEWYIDEVVVSRYNIRETCITLTCRFNTCFKCFCIGDTHFFYYNV